MKKSKHDDIDSELAKSFAGQSPQHAKLTIKVLSLPTPDAIARQKQKRRKRKQSEPQSIVDRVEKKIRETELDATSFRDFILEPPAELSWTKNLDGYDVARLSAENAIRRIFALTEAAHAGFEAGHPESVLLEVFFYKVRNGLIRADNPKILLMLEYAQQVGKTQAYLFIARLADELKNAQKRVPGRAQFPQFRTLLVSHWMHHLFWLMSDDLIARIATTRRIKRDGCNRQTITKIVKELHLVKHRDKVRRPIVKDMGKGDVLVFREGYPPKS